MGYTTEFDGRINIEPALNAEEIAFLNKFADTRRMDCEQGPYYVDRAGVAGQDDNDPLVRNHNAPPQGQPGLWCQWVPTEDGTGIVWNGEEKFYQAPKWMEYLIAHFIGSDPKAKAELPFLQSHTLNGGIIAQGEEIHDRWKLVVVDNAVSIKGLE